MWKALLRFESIALTRDRALLLVVLLVVAATAFGTMNGARSAGSQHAVVERLRTDEATQLQHAQALANAIRTGATAVPRGYWNQPGDTRGYAYYLMTAYAVKPPAALAALTAGQSDLLPYHFKLNAGSRAKALAAYDVENPRRMRLGRFDLSFVLIFLLPLALLAGSYDALATERETGRLALLVTQGLTPRRLAVTRVALRFFVIATFFLASAMCTLALTGLAFGAPGVVSGLRDWFLVALAYIAFWFGLTLFVVAVARSSSGAALALAGIWLALVVLTPWTLNLAARAIHPLPARADFIRAQRDATDSAVRDQDGLRGRFLHDHPELSSGASGSEAVAQFALNQVSSIEHVEAQLAPVAAQFDAQLSRQQALIDRWQWLSPAALAQQALNEVSGTSTARHRAFLEQVDAYVVSIRAYFNPRLLAGELEFTGFNEWPRYVWHEPLSSETQRRVRWAVTGLAFPAVVFALAGIAAVNGAGRLRLRGALLRQERTVVP